MYLSGDLSDSTYGNTKVGHASGELDLAIVPPAGEIFFSLSLWVSTDPWCRYGSLMGKVNAWIRHSSLPSSSGRQVSTRISSDWAAI